MGKQQQRNVTFEIVPEYSTGENEEVDDEIDVILNTFENAKLSGKSKEHRKLHVPLTSEFKPERRVVLEIALVAGYPYVPPRVKISIPGSSKGSCELLSSAEVEYIKKEVNENIQPCLSSGVPCMMQILSTVASIIDGGLPSAVERQTKAPVEHAPKERSAGQSPSLTPVPLKAKEALKLSLFTLHLLRKCCYLRDPESNEEANSNFEWIAGYLFRESDIFLKSVESCVPWRPDVFGRAFTRELQQLLNPDCERIELKKWLWEDEGHGMKLQQGTEGRYQNEFIQQRLLGSGGFAPVYVCRKKIDGRLYAIKKVAMSEKQSEKVIREVQTLAALNHKSIVRYYDAWVEDGCDEELRHFIDDEEDEEEEGELGGSDAEDGSCQGRSRAIRLSSSSGTSTTSRYSSDEDSSDSDTVDEASTDSFTSSDDVESSCARGQVRKGNQPPQRYQTLYIQMELCSARSLRHLIENSDTDESNGLFGSENGEKIAASILRQLLTVTAHTHRERIVHRDLKPDNVLFEMGNDLDDGEIGTIRVADFGLARVMNGVKRNTSTLELADGLGAGERAGNDFAATGNCGSVLYCAPEQEQGLDYDFKVDEFSIGMIALEMWLAIAGKGFRDRFNIMNIVWRTGKLPEWFQKWNPAMSDVIGRLLELDPRIRSSCEDILSTAELPGDPADILEALGTIDRYGERIAGRVVQRLQKVGNQYRKPTPMLRETARLLGSSACTDLVNSVMVIGLLHGHTPVVMYDLLTPMNPELSEMGVESVVDAGGRCFCLSNLPHYAAASFLGMQESNASLGSFYQFYNKTRPYVIITTPVTKPDVFNELALEPLLSVYHLFSSMELLENVELIVSHADWLNALVPKEVGSRGLLDELAHLRGVIDGVEKVGSELSRLSGALVQFGLQPSYERDEFIRRFVSLAFDALHFFGGQLPTNVRVVLDPALLPAETLVHRAAIGSGLIFEFRSTRSSTPFAFGCNLDNFTSKCTVVCPDVSACCVNVDMRELSCLSKHVNIPFREGLLLDGVMVRRHDYYSQTHLATVIEAAVTLWKGNIRACVRVENDLHALSRSMKQKRLRWLLVDGKRIVAAASSQQGKAVTKQVEIPIGELRGAVRTLAMQERSSKMASTTIEVLFASGKQEPRVADQARKLYETMMETPLTALVAAHCGAREVEACFRDIDGGVQDGECAVPQLARWIRANIANYGVVPVFSSRDGLITFFVNHKRYKIVHKDARNGKKK